MRYERTFRFSAAHLNSQKAYEILWLFLDAGKQKNIAPSDGDMFFLLGDIHGHNFKVVVTFEAEGPNDNGWLVEDRECERLVMTWDGCNLSRHHDFVANRERATTELMAMKLFRKLQQEFGDAVACVRIYETDDIFAEYKG